MTNSPCARYFAVHGSWGGVPSLLDAVIINGVRWAGLQCPTAVSIEPQYRPCVAFSVSRPAVRSRGIRPRQRFRHTTRGRDSSLRGYNQISVTASVTSIATPTEINSPRCIPVLQAATTTIRAPTARFGRLGPTDRGPCPPFPPHKDPRDEHLYRCGQERARDDGEQQLPEPGEAAEQEAYRPGHRRIDRYQYRAQEVGP